MLVSHSEPKIGTNNYILVLVSICCSNMENRGYNINVFSLISCADEAIYQFSQISFSLYLKTLRCVLVTRLHKAVGIYITGACVQVGHF